MRKLFLFSVMFVFFLFVPIESYSNSASFVSGQLRNGLTYYIHHDPHAKKHIFLDFVIKTGSLDEKEDERGFSHLSEHIILDNVQFKNKKISDEYCDIWDFTSPRIGAITSYAFTQYHLEISLAIPEGLEAGLLGFSNMLSHFSLDEPYFQGIKGKVLEELEKNQSSPIMRWKQWRLNQECPLYKNKHPLGHQEAISQASSDKFLQFYRAKYEPGHMGVIIIGNVDLQETVHLIEKHYGNIPTVHEQDAHRPPLALLSGGSSIYIDHKLKNNLLSLAQPIFKTSERDALTSSIWTQLLSRYLRNRIATFQPILETLVDPPMLRVTVSLGEDLEEGVRQLSEALNSFFNQPITEEQLAFIKTDMKNNLEALQDQDPSLIDFYREHFLLQTPSLEADHPSLRASFLDTIHAEEINQMLHDFQGFTHVSLGSPHDKAKHVSPELLSILFLKRYSYVD